jgi:hypothetical protein
MNTTGKQRLLAILARQPHDRVPFMPNIWQWFYHHQYAGTLPPQLQGCKSYIDALRLLGADLFHKLAGLVQIYEYPDCNYQATFSGTPLHKPAVTERVIFTGGASFQERWETPYGPLSHEWVYREYDGTALETHHMLEDFDSQYPAILYWMERMQIKANRELFERGLKEVGEDGLVPIYLLGTPLKQIHWLARQDRASVLLLDYPKEMERLMDIHAQRLLEHLEEVLSWPEAWLFIIRDNVDSMFYTPRFFRQYCLPTVKKAADMAHARNKYLFLHACGKLKKLAALIAESGVDSMDGHSPEPPLGDWPFHEALAIRPDYLVTGGMFVPYQELPEPDGSMKIRNYVRDLFNELGQSKDRLIFSTSCNWSPIAPWENLIAFRDAVMEFGTL